MVEVEKGREEVVEGAGARPFVVVGIPAFNEEKTIGRVVLQRLLLGFTMMESLPLGWDGTTGVTYQKI